MNSQMRNLFAILLGISVGNMVAERFLLKAAPNDPNGFVNPSAGFGLDDIVRAGAGAAGAVTMDMLLRRVL